MKIQTSRFGSHTGKLAILSVLLSAGFATQAFAYNPITSTLDYGAKGSNVTSLQSFFAANSSIYPEGLVTGYFGGLTRAAVQRFQALYGIVSSGTAATTGYGRVGPTTLAKINDLIASGGWSSTPVTTGGAPLFYNVSQTQSSNSATFTFNTNQPTTAYVVYSQTPLMFNEGDINGVGFGPIGGSSVIDVSGQNSSHSITVPSLQSNTTYYYTVFATNAAGQVSVYGPNNSFHTGF
jgi:peptidoglycan hydrolase-like protein with peptidoglycan-binding domain